MKTIEFQRSTPERSLRIQGWLIRAGDRVGLTGYIADLKTLQQCFDPKFTYPLCKRCCRGTNIDDIIGHAKLEMRGDGIWVKGYIIPGNESEIWWNILADDLVDHTIRFGFFATCKGTVKGPDYISEMAIGSLALGVGNLGGTVENMTFVEKGYE